MGWFSCRGVAGVDLLFVKNLVCLLLLALVSGSAAAGLASAATSSVTKSGSSYTMKAGTGATAANGAYNMAATVNMSGVPVTMPASARFASNAAQFAIAATRLTPATFIAGAVGTWLLSEGLQWANNSWTKQTSGASFEWATSNRGIVRASAQAVADAYCASVGSGSGNLWQWMGGTGEANASGAEYRCSGNFYQMVTASRYCTGTTLGALPDGSNCAPVTQSAPATEADFAAAAAKPVPDAVAQQFYDAGQPLPIDAPVLNPAPVDKPLGNPYVDPRTGKTVQPKVRVTPDPTADDPFRVRVDPYTVEVAPAPVPVPGEPAPLPIEEQPKDPCLENPDRVGCLDTGNPDDVSLDNYSVPFTVNPVSVGGAGACPPDSVLTVHGGQQVTVKLGPICDAAIWLRPLVLALAWFSAAYIIAGAVKES